MARLATLTALEHRVALLMADRLSAEEISELTGRSTSAVEALGRAIRSKLQPPSGTDLVTHLRAQLGWPDESVAAVTPSADRRRQLVLRATVADLARLAGRAARRGADLASSDDPEARGEGYRVLMVADEARNLHASLVSLLRQQESLIAVAREPDLVVAAGG